MITEALLHCRGVGRARLGHLHDLGIRTWADAVDLVDQVPESYRSSLLEECSRCLDALQRRDVRYFVERLVPQDKWRIVAEFLDQASFFDIETSGLEYDAEITVIACWHQGQLHTFVEHENLDDFLTLLDDITVIASFNGSSFDVPRILDYFHIPELPCPHIDLRWSCYHKGLIGRLESIAHQLGISRPCDLQDIDGKIAVQLWQRWRSQGDNNARSKLIRYCAGDVLLLVMLANRLASRRASRDAALWSQLPHEGNICMSRNEPIKVPHPHFHMPFGSASPSRMRGLRKSVTG